MKHIKEQWNQEIYESAQWRFYFEGLRVGVLDIETTGLNPASNKFVLGCLYDVAPGLGTLHQVLAQSRAEEPATLSEYMKLVNEMDVVVTYNGRKFDVPFLEKRCEVTGTGCDVKVPCYNLDLFHVLNSYSPIKRLVPNMKQKTIENYMGFWDSRSDEISGAESVELFNHYEATGDAEAERRILLHNNDDVRQLTRLTKAITKSDFHRAMFNLGFPVKCSRRQWECREDKSEYPEKQAEKQYAGYAECEECQPAFREAYSLLVVKKIKLRRETIEISGLQLKSPINYVGFEFNGWPVSSRFEMCVESGICKSAGTGMKSMTNEPAGIGVKSVAGKSAGTDMKSMTSESAGTDMKSMTSESAGTDMKSMTSESAGIGVKPEIMETGTFEMKIPLIRQGNLAITDLRAAGLEDETREPDFAAYPMYGSGFLVIEEDGEIRYRETNHFVREFLKGFLRSI